jgi:Rod binding domain-containing protein
VDPILPLGLQTGVPTTPRAAAPGAEADRLRDTARELEGVFLGLLMKAMRSTVGSGGLFKEGTDTQTYRDMFDQEIGRSMARAGGIGLAQMVLRDQALRQAAEAGSRRHEEDGAIQPPRNIDQMETLGPANLDGTPREKTPQVLSTDDRYLD